MIVGKTILSSWISVACQGQYFAGVLISSYKDLDFSSDLLFKTFPVRRNLDKIPQKIAELFHDTNLNLTNG